MEMDEIYQSYAKTVYKYLLSLSRDPDTAEELTAETFYQAYRSIHRYNGECKMVVWLCQIGKHLWYREIDRRSKYRSVCLDDVSEAQDSQMTPDAQVSDGQMKVNLYRQLHNLDESTREVMYLRLMGDLSYKEIGDILGKSENWSRVTFYRGKEKLRKGSGEYEI